MRVGRAVARLSTATQELFKAHGTHSTLRDLDDYKMQYERSLQDPQGFWSDMGEQTLDWDQPFQNARAGSFAAGDVRYYTGGKLNMSANCLDRHVDAGRGDTTAIMWEGDEPGTSETISYKEVLQETCRLASVLKEKGVKRGDTVAIYMPMVPQAAYAMLACSRIGAIHAVVFAGFSAEAVRDRIKQAGARVVITADEGVRGGKVIPLKRTVDEALQSCPEVHSVLVHKRTSHAVPMAHGRDEHLCNAMARHRPWIDPVSMNSEDPLFVLYTSGSTGKPKGVVHSTGGYAVYTGLTSKIIFDLNHQTRFCCAADIGWITGHSYLVYGPLLNGSSTVMFESLPTYPDASRYWEMVERRKLEVFYTSPTAIRSLMKHDDSYVEKHDLSSLRTLGSVGESINEAAWLWYYNKVGRRSSSICDTYWQTESGGILLSGITGITPMKPGSASLPFFGVQPVITDNEGSLGFKNHWAGVARTVLGDHQRYLDTYVQPGTEIYITGDAATIDDNGFVTVSGRTDDVISKAGHRLGTSEIESALVGDGQLCTEAAVVAIPHDVMGQAIVAYAIAPDASANVVGELKHAVRTSIGGIAVPDKIIVVPDLPKTRSGKIMRRMLRRVAMGEVNDFGDTTTLTDPAILEEIIELTNSEA